MGAPIYPLSKSSKKKTSASVVLHHRTYGSVTGGSIVSAWNKNPLISFLMSGFAFGFPVAAELFVTVPDWLLRLFRFTWSNGMMVDPLIAEFQTVNVFGWPVLYPVFSLFILVIASVLVLTLLYRFMARKQIS
ncbi:hypothetical protein [Sporolactobacillus sp. THM19-2]|uniref:hypothetical protein n=1 Tax=Sporolactobacillus sp. THM19-2 TaxID=2511171 RepID=UPI0010E3812C|nr:hypothetical protein [Sporolactobacillus sp. THM19-2]RYL94564.1 hypothetical protein EWH91_00830 [Sporolactobacillus sp. THM19-2]